MNRTIVTKLLEDPSKVVSDNDAVKTFLSPRPFSEKGAPWVWGPSGSTSLMDQPGRPGEVRVRRTVRSQATASALFLWLCQLRRAPYSYDWIDNFGKRSPRVPDRTLVDLVVGQEFMTIFTLVNFTDGQFITLSMKPGWPTRVFGDIRLTYAVEEAGAGGMFLHAEMWIPLVGRLLPRLRRYLLAWGDLIMMRKQLKVISDLASREGPST
jgi:hypothetical protein